jgi:hypothetical protein
VVEDNVDNNYRIDTKQATTPHTGDQVIDYNEPPQHKVVILISGDQVVDYNEPPQHKVLILISTQTFNRTVT